MRGLLGLLPLFGFSNGMYFKLEAGSEKCLKEEVHKDVLVTGNYNVEDKASIDVDIKITDSKAHILFQKEEANEGKFAFTLDTADVFSVCFNARAGAQAKKGEAVEVELTIKRGVEAKNYDELAKAEQLKPLELELRRLEDLTESIVNDFALMKKREEEMRDTNESTNSRVLYFSIFSMACLIFLATWQVLYLKKYFKKQRLID